MVPGDTGSQRVRDIVDVGALADQAGLDVFGVDEHRTLRFAVSSPAVVLAAAAVAAKTSFITLTGAVSVLSVLDPVRLHQDFAQLDLVSDGHAEITAGRSAYTEPFDIFGVDMEHYDERRETRPAAHPRHPGRCHMGGAVPPSAEKRHHRPPPEPHAAGTAGCRMVNGQLRRRTRSAERFRLNRRLSRHRAGGLPTTPHPHARPDERVRASSPTGGSTPMPSNHPCPTRPPTSLSTAPGTTGTPGTASPAARKRA
ncbi:LLM class flavin-dependent oxidoreductase [Streptomyces sp. B1I3]|uniref:LLM class flavin-dependent oxidoreductase n=1 Tax=Streptomyces sp. B1I3 TaxID=3042264 RepID=UPI00358EBFE2